MARTVKREEPIRCSECERDGSVRPRVVAVVVITDTGYDVWTRSRRRRPLMDPEGTARFRVEDPGPVHRRAEPNARVRCGRDHRGERGSVTLDEETIAIALRRAGASADLPRVRIDPPEFYVDVDVRPDPTEAEIDAEVLAAYHAGDLDIDPSDLDDPARDGWSGP
jgi:hypothetical protein